MEEVREMERSRKSLSFLSRLAIGVFLGLDRALKLTLTFVVKNNREHQEFCFYGHSSTPYVGMFYHLQKWRELNTTEGIGG